jgi:hypothetical protein
MPRENGDAWIASITYMPMEITPIPIPGLAYEYISEDFQLMIGVPVELHWRIAENWIIEAGYLPVRRIKSQVTYKPDDKLNFFASFDWTNDNYLLSDRENRSDFFFHFEKRLFTGLRLRPHKNITVDCVGGYAFDRMYFEGENYQDRWRDRIDVSAGFYGQLRIGVTF